MTNHRRAHGGPPVSAARLKRFMQAFDWKLVISLFALCVVLVVLLGKVQDTQTIDRQDKQLAKANDTIALNTQIIQQNNRDAEKRSAIASKDRRELLRRIDLLTRILRDNGLDVPDSALTNPPGKSSASSPSAGATASRPNGSSSGGSSSGGTLKPRAASGNGTSTSSGSGSGSSGGGSTGGGSTGGGGGSTPAPAPEPEPRGGPLTPLVQLPVVCRLIGPCPNG